MNRRQFKDEVVKCVSAFQTIDKNPNALGIYSVYDVTRTFFNPPFVTDDVTAINLFVNAFCEAPDISLALYRVGRFSCETGAIETEDTFLVNTLNLERWHDDVGCVEAVKGGFDE